MKYTIKEISELLGVTTHNLRYYEKIGIIKPEVNDATGYRYFSVIDTRRFNLSRFYRGLGFSVDKCIELLGSMKIDEIASQVDEMVESLKEELIFKNCCVEDMQKYVAFLNEVPKFVDHVQVIHCEEFVRLEFSDKEKITKDKNILKLREKLLQYPPLIRWVSRIPKDILSRSEGDLIYHYGIQMRKASALQLGLELEGYDKIDEGDYLITVFKKNNDPAFGWETLRLMQEYMKENHIHFGDGYSSCIHSIINDKGYENYHYLMVKIS